MSPLLGHRIQDDSLCPGRLHHQEGRPIRAQHYTSHYCIDQSHCRKGESITDLVFVVSGSLEVVQDGEILAFLGTNDVCGDSHWKETLLGKSVVHVRALTYCDIHTINVDDLLKVETETQTLNLTPHKILFDKVLEFHKPFAITFSRNLCLTFDLSRRVVFSMVKHFNF